MAAVKKPKDTDRPEMPVQKLKDPPKHAGDMPKTCSNCQHFRPDKFTSARREGECHNGISGRIRCRAIDGCAFGFYPSIERFPLRAGPGGVR